MQRPLPPSFPPFSSRFHPCPIASTTPPRLILASSSRYRRELLERLRVPFDVIVPDIDETPLDGETPETTAVRLSIAKARAAAVPGAGRARDRLGSGRDLRRPADRQARHARQRARATAGDARAQRRCFTARCACSTAVRTTSSRPISLRACSSATCRTLKSTRICAPKRLTTSQAAPNPRASASRLLDAIDSTDPTALVGLPLIALSRMLRAAGFPLLEAR